MSSDSENLVRMEGVRGSNLLSSAERSSRFSWVYVHVCARPCRAAVVSQDQGRRAPRFRGNVPRNCVRGLRRVGWPRLTGGPERKNGASAQVKAKREDLIRSEDLISVPGGCGCPRCWWDSPG